MTAPLGAEPEPGSEPEPEPEPGVSPGVAPSLSEKAWESERASKEVALEALAALRASDVCVERDLEQVTPTDCTLIMIPPVVRWGIDHRCLLVDTRSHRCDA
eukprot:COSAG01_NODE_17549_length_1142_cov_1.001918_1_plen_101_part_01